MLDCVVNGVLLVWESIWGLASRGTVVLELMLSNTSELPSPDITYLFYARLPQFSLMKEILRHFSHRIGPHSGRMITLINFIQSTGCERRIPVPICGSPSSELAAFVLSWTGVRGIPPFGLSTLRSIHFTTNSTVTVHPTSFLHRYDYVGAQIASFLSRTVVLCSVNHKFYPNACRNVSRVIGVQV